MAKHLLKMAGPVLLAMAATGCATAPTQEMSDARQAVQAARDADAPLHTPAAMDSAEHDLTQAELQLSDREYQQARNDAMAAKQEAVKARNMALALAKAKQAVQQADQAGALTQVTRDWVAKAQAAATAGDEEEVMRTAQEAQREAADDLRRQHEESLRAARENQEWLDKVPPLLEVAHRAEVRLTPDQRQQLIAAEAAYRQQDGRKAYDLAQGLAAQLKALPPGPQTLNYKVLEGDTLWKIAERPAVYGNPLLWPLIYRSNHQQIKDADRLTPGQTLTIELNPATEQARQAMIYAGRRDGGAEKLKELDAQYLRDVK